MRRTKQLFMILCMLMIVQSVRAFEGPVQDSLNMKNKHKAFHTLSMNYGIGLITSEVQDGWSGKKYNGRAGQDLHIGYKCTFGKRMGFGLLANYSNTDFSTTSIELLYIAPEFVYQGNSKKWMYSASLGLGYARCDDGYQKKGGLGIHYSVGGEYLFSRHIGIGADFLSLSSFYGDSEVSDYAFDGISRFSLLVGLRFHL